MIVYLDKILLLKAVHSIQKDEIIIWTAITILAGGLAGIKIFQNTSRRDLFRALHVVTFFCLFGIGYCINQESILSAFFLILILQFFFQVLSSALYIYQTEVLQDNGLVVAISSRILIFGT